MTGEPEIYDLGHWRGLPKRARGPKKHPAAKVKREMAAYIQRHPELSNGAKLVGALLVSWYSESKRCAWPSNKTVSEELAIGVRRVQEYTAELHEQGLIYKVVGGGWDKGTVRHTSNRYYPAFSRVVNQDTGHIIRNAPFLCTESPETCRNPSDPMTETASVRKSHPANRENRQISAAPHDGNRVPYDNKEYGGGAPASPASPPSGSGGLAVGRELPAGKEVTNSTLRVRDMARYFGIPEDHLIPWLADSDNFPFADMVRKYVVNACRDKWLFNFYGVSSPPTSAGREPPEVFVLVNTLATVDSLATVEEITPETVVRITLTLTPEQIEEHKKAFKEFMSHPWRKG